MASLRAVVVAARAARHASSGERRARAIEQLFDAVDALDARGTR